MTVSAQLQTKLDATLASQKSALEAAQRYLTEGKALCIGGDRFAEAKAAFEKGLAEKPSDPELVSILRAAIAQFTSASDEEEEEAAAEGAEEAAAEGGEDAGRERSREGEDERRGGSAVGLDTHTENVVEESAQRP